MMTAPTLPGRSARREVGISEDEPTTARSRRTALGLVTLGPVLVGTAVLGWLSRAAGSATGAEGELVARAWALGHLDSVPPAVSWWSQPPLAAPFLAVLAGISGTFDRVGDPVLAARTVMVAVTVVSTALVWVLARRIGLPRWAALVATIAFGLSPVGIVVHRPTTAAALALPFALGATALLAGPRCLVSSSRGLIVAVGFVLSLAIGLHTDPVAVAVAVGSVGLACIIDKSWRHRGGESFLPGVAVVLLVALLVPISVRAYEGQFGDQRAPARAAERWIATNVGADAGIVVDDATGAGLAAAGRPVADLVWSRTTVDRTARDADPAAADPAGIDWRRAGYLVSTPELRSAAERRPGLAAALGSSMVIAIFGSGDDRTEVRVITPDGPDVRQVDLEADRALSARAGAALAANPSVGLSQRIGSALANGEVDLRLLTTVATLAPDRTVSLIDLVRDPAEAKAGGRYRTVVLSVPTGDEDEVLAFFARQEGRFRPLSVEPVAAPQPDAAWIRVTYRPV
jgi:hypothetical protein